MTPRQYAEYQRQADVIEQHAKWKKEMMDNNPYIDINFKDRSKEVEDDYAPTLEDIKNDPEFYAELVNDLMYHWVYGTRETPMMVLAKRNMLLGHGSLENK